MATRPDGRQGRRAAGWVVRLGLLLLLPATAGAEIASGSYAGNGASGRAVSVGFQPDVVIVRRDDPDPNPGPAAVVRTATMTGSKEMYSTTPVALASGLIASITPSGFTVDPDSRTNQNGYSYFWIAWKAVPGHSAVGSYDGDGTDSRKIPAVGSLGFTPAWVVVVPQGPYNPYHQSSAMPVDESFHFGNSTGDPNRIQKPLADGFEVGNADETNRSGVRYHYVAWKAVPGRMAVGFYNGDGQDDRSIMGVGFRPEYVVVKRDGSSAPAHKPLATGADTDYALLFNAGYDDSNWIQALEADGFQVGDHVRVNASGDRHYWMAWANADSTALVTTTAGQKLTVETAEVKMVWDTAKGGGLHELYGKTEGSPLTSRVGDDALYNLFLTGVYDGTAWRRESQSAGTLELLEATNTRVRLRQKTDFNLVSQLHLQRDWTVQRSPRLAIKETLVFDLPFPGLRGSTGIHGRGVSSCGSGPFYCKGASNPSGSRVWFITDDDSTYSDMLAIPYTSPFFGRDASPAWEQKYEAGSPNTYLARVLEQSPVAAGPGTDTRFYLFYPHLEGLTTGGTQWQPYTDDYRAPATLTVTPGRGSLWLDPAENTSGTDAFNEAEAAYVLDMNPGDGLDFSLSGSVSLLPRRRPFFKVRQWRSLQPPATLVLQGQTLVRNRDYVADVKPVAWAVFCNDPSCVTFTKLARGGLVGDTDEFLADPARNSPLAFVASGAQYLYLGADAKFRGFNVSLDVPGTGTADLKWEYWNGTAWVALNAVPGFTDLTNDLRQSGSVFWGEDPAGWAPGTTPAGGPVLHYVRASLAAGTSYSTPPTEREIRTDILLLQHGGDITASGQRFIVAAAGAATNYRSIGSAGAYGTGTVTATLGSTLVTGTGTAWRTANRGRGDAITIAGVPYTVYTVLSDTEIELTSPYTEPSGSGKAHTIARQFSTLQAWETCISGGGGCGPFPVGSNSLVVDNRNEVGVVFRDSPFNLAASLVIGGVLTDADHTITLTADHGNRHYGLAGAAGTRALINMTGSNPAIVVQADYVTVEWLEIVGDSASGSSAHGVQVSNTGTLNRIVLDSLLIHDVPGDGILLGNADAVADVYNNVIYEARRGIDISAAPSAFSRIRLLNNTVFSCAQAGIVATTGSTTVLLRNNIAHSCMPDFSVPSRDPLSSHNLGSDGSGVSHSSGATGVNVLPANAGTLFVSVVIDAEDLHIKPGSAADSAGVNLSTLFTRDVDAGVRPSSTSWDIGADELPAVATDLAVAKTDFQTVLVPGSPALVTYSITVTNNGPNAVTELKMTDSMPPGFVFLDWQPASSGSYDPGTETWSFGANPLDPGESATVQLRGTVDPYARGTLVNTATVQPPPDVTDPVPQNDVANDTDTLTPQVDLVLSKTDDLDPVPVGERLTYTLEVRNLGLSGATGVTLADTLPPDMAFDAVSPSQGSCSFDTATRTLGCSLGSIDPAALATVVLVVRPRAVGTFTNQASVSLNEPDSDPLSNSAAQDTTVEVSANALRAFTATSTSDRNVLEWVNPALDFDHTEVWYRTDRFPTAPGDGTPVDPAGVAGSGATWPVEFTVAGGRVTFPHDLPGGNGTTHYYAAFFYHGDGVTPSLGRFCTGRPFDHTSGPVKWAFSTGATAVTPPTVGGAGVIAPSNDDLVYAMERGPAGGLWPASWVPAQLNGPVQSRSPVVPITVDGSSPVVYLGAQDGAVHAIDGAKGGAAPFLWSSPIATMVQAAPAGIFTAFGGAYDYLLVGTRDAGADNAFVALDPLGTPGGGSVVGSFDNGGGSLLGIGIINAAAAVDYATRRVYFTSRRSTIGGSTNTLWCLELTGSPVFTLDWARDLGDIDGSPVLRNGRVYVGSAENGGTVHSIDSLNGDNPLLDRTYVHGDGQVKGFVFPDRNSPNGDIYFATDRYVWGVEDTAGGMSEKFGGGISLGAGVTPSAVLFVPGDHYVYVGGSDGRLHEIDVLGPTVKSVPLGDGLATVGAPSLDRGYDLVHVGSVAGIFYAVAVPLP